MKSWDLSRRNMLRLGAQLPLAGLVPVAATTAAAAPAAPTTIGNFPPGVGAVTVTPYKINVPQERLDKVMRRLRDAEWPDVPYNEPDSWAYGCSVTAMRDLVDYTLNKYDWRAQEAMMNRFPHFMAHVEGYDIHFIHVKGSGKNPQPAIITHGWPGSFVEFLKIIEPLTNPEKHGGKAEDSFTVVVPSMPGYGFSSKPAGPIAISTVARLFDRVMVEGLGYDKYIAVGGDVGAVVSTSLGYQSPHCTAVHLNILLGGGFVPVTDEEKTAYAGYEHFRNAEGAYMAIQGTKPLTLGYAMTDSPIGQMAWIFEKFRTWAGVNGDPWSVFTRDEILNNIMVYILPNKFQSASWSYTGGGKDKQPFPMGRLEKPFGVAHYPHEVYSWTRSYAEANYQLIQWSDMPAGGHFAAFEQPKLYVDDLRSFKKKLRSHT